MKSVTMYDCDWLLSIQFQPLQFIFLSQLKCALPTLQCSSREEGGGSCNRVVNAELTILDLSSNNKN